MPKAPTGCPTRWPRPPTVRQTFRRMAMNDIETAALIVGGHAFGKSHGAGPQDKVGPPPAAAPLEQQDLGLEELLRDRCRRRHHLEWTRGHLDADADPVGRHVLENLYGYDWESYVGAGGLWQWRPKNDAGADSVPFPDDLNRHHQPNMLTSDIALKVDPMYEQITRRWLANPQELAEEFRKAWFKLIHRDLGPLIRYRGSMVPSEPQLFQDPIEPVTDELIGAADIAALEEATARHRPHPAAADLHRVVGGVVLLRAATCAAARTVDGSGWRRSATGSATNPRTCRG